MILSAETRRFVDQLKTSNFRDSDTLFGFDPHRYPPLLAAAQDATTKAMAVLSERFEAHKKNSIAFTTKHDGSPVTSADKEADQIIRDILTSATGIPVVSEEKEIPFEARKHFRTFWLIDPLDGTRNFLAKDAEFSVNIALIHDGQPRIAIIGVPSLKTIYHALEHQGAFKTGPDGIEEKITASKEPNHIWLTSRHHRTNRDNEFLVTNGLALTNVLEAGSALKFCLIAEGTADGYAKTTGNSEWDTAAGELILREAGGKVVDYATKQPLIYNKPSMKNDGYIAVAPHVNIANLKII